MKQLLYWSWFVLMSIISTDKDPNSLDSIIMELPATSNDVELMNAALVAPNGYAYFMKGKYCHQYDIRKDKLIAVRNLGNDAFRGIPVNVDAALMHPNGKGYIFKGNQYFRFNFSNGQRDKTGIIGQDGWKGLTGPFDGAISHPTNNKAYFFKGPKYYRFDYKTDKMDKVGTISQDGWKGVPSNIDLAIMHSNGKAYFFKDDYYYRYDFNKSRVDKSGLIGSNGWPGLFIKSIDARINDFDIVRGTKGYTIQSLKSMNTVRVMSLSNAVFKTYNLGVDIFLGIPRNVDCGFSINEENNKEYAYIFNGDSYYKYDGLYSKIIESGRIGYDDWKGIPPHLDAALVYNGYGYFFKGDKYYRYNFSTKSHDKTGIIGEDDWKGVPKNLDAAHKGIKNIYFYKKSTEYRYSYEKKNVVENLEIPKGLLN